MPADVIVRRRDGHRRRGPRLRAMLGEISEEPRRLTRRSRRAPARGGRPRRRWMAAAGMTTRATRGTSSAATAQGRRRRRSRSARTSTRSPTPDVRRPLGIVARRGVERLAAGGRSPRFPVEVARSRTRRARASDVAYLGSAAYTGAFEPAWLDQVDGSGIDASGCDRSLGDDPDCPEPAPRRAPGYLEVHIEQGPVLEREGLPVGVVTAIAGQTRARIVLRARRAMRARCRWTWRHDALAAAAEAVLAVERHRARRDAGSSRRSARSRCRPNAANVVPGEVRSRSTCVTSMTAFARADGRGGASRLADRRNAQVELDWEVLQETPAVAMARPGCASASSRRRGRGCVPRAR